jgi:hypothetical protein
VSTRWLCSIRGTRRGSRDREDSLNPEHPPSHLLSRTMGRRSCDLVVRHDRHLYPNPLTDSSRASSGFKINVANLESLSLSLGVNTTAPAAAVGVSVNYGPFFTVNVSEGVNPISLTGMNVHGPSVVRINVENWQNNRLNLESISVNRVCRSSSHNWQHKFKSRTGRLSPSLCPAAPLLPVHRRFTLRRECTSTCFSRLLTGSSL